MEVNLLNLLNKRSAGSLFKNPNGNSAGKLLDEAGLKGFSIGDAKISEKHANFFVNDGKRFIKGHAASYQKSTSRS